MCDGLSPAMPQYAPAPTMTSDVPVFVVTASYEHRASASNIAAMFTGFSNVTSVLAKGLSSVPAQVPDCYLAVKAAFFSAPTSSVDATCLADPDVQTLS